MRTSLLHIITITWLLIALIVTCCTALRYRWRFGSSHVNQEAGEMSPGSRASCGHWDEFYYVWIFGGLTSVSGKQQLSNDLWDYNKLKNTWTMVHPGSTSQDISSKNKNRAPKPRRLSSLCGVSGLMLVMFGGMDQNKNKLGDTWIYLQKDKSWLPLSEMLKKLRNETIGESPSPRADSVTWCLRDKMIIFGGFSQNNQQLRDMWEFSLVDLTWTQEKSSRKLHNPGIIPPATITYPGGRSGSTSWISRNYDKLFMFGGNIHTSDINDHHSSGFSTGLWEYDLKTGLWKFIMGYDGECKPGHYGKKGFPNENNIPGCRRGAIGWTDTQGHLWMFGGEGATSDPHSISSDIPDVILGDLWYYDFDYKLWSWVGGSDQPNGKGSYHGQANNQYENDNLPSSRSDAIAGFLWNELIIIGGVGHDSTKAFGLLNDIWGIDAHSEVAYYNSAWPGTIFMLLFFFLGITFLVVVIYFYLRKHFNKGSVGGKNYDVEYSMLKDEGD